jgi:hypothetical protein
MKLNMPLSLSFEPKAVPAGRWWLGWLQLLCAWLLCMLLCANVALVLTKGWPQDEAAPQAKTSSACALAETTARPGASGGQTVPQKPVRTPRCGGA